MDYDILIKIRNGKLDTIDVTEKYSDVVKAMLKDMAEWKKSNKTKSD